MRDEVTFICISRSFFFFNDLLKYFKCTIIQSSDVVEEEPASWLNDCNKHSEVLSV